jgi:hypothetical protein
LNMLRGSRKKKSNYKTQNGLKDDIKLCVQSDFNDKISSYFYNLYV